MQFKNWVGSKVPNVGQKCVIKVDLLTFNLTFYRASDDFTCNLQQEHTLSQEEMMEGIKKGILKGFLELDEKLRKIPEVASGEDKSGTTAVCALISQVQQN